MSKKNIEDFKHKVKSQGKIEDILFTDYLYRKKFVIKDWEKRPLGDREYFMRVHISVDGVDTLWDIGLPPLMEQITKLKLPATVKLHSASKGFGLHYLWLEEVKKNE